MRAADNPIRKAVMNLIDSRPGIVRREITKYLQRTGYRIESKALSAMLRRMREEGQIYHTGQPMRFAYWPSKHEVVATNVEQEEVLAVTQIRRPAATSDFNYPFYSTPMAWSVAQLARALCA